MFFLHDASVASIRLSATPEGYELTSFAVHGKARKVLPRIGDLVEMARAPGPLGVTVPSVEWSADQLASVRAFDARGRLLRETSAFSWTEVETVDERTVRTRRGVDPLGDGELSTTTVIVDDASVRHEHRGATVVRRGEVRVTTTPVARGGFDVTFDLPPTAPPSAVRRVELRRKKHVAEAWTIDVSGGRVQRGAVAPTDEAMAAVLASIVESETAARLGPRRHPLGWYTLESVAVRAPADLLTAGTHTVTLEVEVHGATRTQSLTRVPIEGGEGLASGPSAAPEAEIRLIGGERELVWLGSKRRFVAPADRPLVELIARPCLTGDVADEHVEVQGPERRTRRVASRHAGGAPHVVEEWVAHAREARLEPRFVVELGGEPRFAQVAAPPTSASGAPMTFIGRAELRCAMPGWLLLFADLAGGEVVQRYEAT